MTNDPARTPAYDPEADGLPGTVDPDSTAYDEAESGREADGPDSTLWPTGQPVALDGHGTTPREARDGSSITQRVKAEVPDVREGYRDPHAAFIDTVDDSSVRDTGEYDSDGDGDPVGRLVAPDGSADDANDDRFGVDAGMAGGGMSAEESAMHVINEDSPDGDYEG